MPPSVNHLYARTRKGVILTHEYERWRYEAMLTLRLPELLVPPKYMTMHLAFFMHTARSDWDNYIKATADAVARSIGVDDNRIYTGHVYKFVDRKNARVEGVLEIDEEGPDLKAWTKFHLSS